MAIAGLTTGIITIALYVILFIIAGAFALSNSKEEPNQISMVITDIL